jgi:osmoprotectant transport system permease protein
VGAPEGDGVSDFLDAFPFIWHHWSLLWSKMLDQLEISAVAFLLSAAIAIPLGVWLGHIHRGSFLAVNLGNIGRALPSLAVIAILIAPLGIGREALYVALVVLAVPVMLTNAYVAVDGVEDDVTDAARGTGMRGLQVLWHAELPLAIPLLFAGIRTAAVYIVATVPLGALAGTDGGLGEIIVNQASYRLEGVIGAAICVAVLALVVDALFAGLQRLVTPRGLRARVDYAELQTEVARGVPAAALP